MDRAYWMNWGKKEKCKEGGRKKGRKKEKERKKERKRKMKIKKLTEPKEATEKGKE